MMKPALQSFARIIVLLAGAAALSGCTYWVSKQEQALEAAGFQVQPANTPERQAMLSNLPSHEFVHDVRDSQISYTYADPLICQCLYVGSDRAYEHYLRLGAAINGNAMGGLQGGGPYNQQPLQRPGR